MSANGDKSAAKVREDFALRLRAVRVSAGFASAEAFARELGMTQTETYRRWERGETEPGLSHLRMISEKTGASLDFLIGGKMGERAATAPQPESRPFKKPKSSRSP